MSPVDSADVSVETSAPARPRWVWIPVLIWCAVIFTLSSFSRLPAPPGGMTDKDAHFLTYGFLGVLLVNALAGARWRGVTGRVALTTIALATAYGVTDELHQLFVPGRDCSIFDLMADALGASTAAVGLLLLCAIIRRAKPADDQRNPAPRT